MTDAQNEQWLDEIFSTYINSLVADKPTDADERSDLYEAKIAILDHEAEMVRLAKTRLVNVTIYADTFNNKNESTLVWSGRLSSVPREGDVVFIFEGWGGSRVTRVYWDLPENSTELHIDDRSEEYRQEIQRLTSKESES